MLEHAPGQAVDGQDAALHKDDDLDGVNNGMCPQTPAGETVDASGCSGSQEDADLDGVWMLDLCPNTAWCKHRCSRLCRLAIGF